MQKHNNWYILQKKKIRQNEKDEKDKNEEPQ